MNRASQKRSNAKPRRTGKAAPERDPNTFVHKLPSGKLPIDATAGLAADGIAGNTIAIREWSSSLYGEIDITSLQDAVVRAGDSINRGDLGGAEAMLMAQAISLNAIFVKLARRANACELLEQFQVNLRLALKAQGQCRATIETLALMKNPPVFAQQANIANGPQQVNSQTVINGPASRAAISEAAPTKLLESRDERLDGNATSEAIAGDSSLAPVGEVHGPANARREGARVQEWIPRRRAIETSGARSGAECPSTPAAS